ncbi:MAG: hypothetical protein ABR899_05660 [Candidatus Krumholzibacteriaceae bacterium]|jgi:hypothetical protein
MKLRMLACICAALACTPAFPRAQTKSIYSNLANPAIGFNALFLDQAARDLNEPYGPQFQESEISLLSVVDPYWNLWANIVFAPDGVDPEEVYATTTRIPSIQLKIGKLRATFGKHGLLHTHAFPFIQAPVIMANTIGEEGFKAAGMEAAWLTPIPWYCELTGGIYQGAGPDAGHPLDFGSTEHDNVPFLGHLKNEVDVNDNTTLELGASALSGKGTDGHTHAAYGADLTLRNVPLRRSNQRGWILQGEYIEKGSYPGGTYSREQHGWYASYQYRWSQICWTGLRAEEAFDSFTDVLTDLATGDPVPGHIRRVSANVAWTPSEFSFIRLEYSIARADDGKGNAPLDRRLMVQMCYTIGYHPAHAY